MAKRKFATGGETSALDALASGGDKTGSFDTDTYARARKAMQDAQSGVASKPTPSKRKPVDPTAGEARDKAAQRAADLMGDEAPTKAVTPAPANDESRIGPTIKRAAAEDRARAARSAAKAADDDMMRPGRDAIEGVYPEALLIGPGGAAVGRGLQAAGSAARSAVNTGRIARAIEAPTVSAARAPAAEVAKDTARFTPTQEVQAAESTIRGALKRAELQKNRAEFGSKFKSKGGAGKEEAVDTTQIESTMRGGANRAAIQRKRAEAAKDMEDAGYKRGGKIQKYAKGGSIDGCAQRGKTRGAMR